MFEKLPATKLKEFATIRNKKFRRESGIFVIEGIKLIEELLNSDLIILAVIIRNDFESERLTPLFAGKKSSMYSELNDRFPVWNATSKDFERLSELENSEGIIAYAKIPKFLSFFPENQPGLALYRINDPGNMGALMRSADWFGINNIILITPCVDPYNAKSVRSSMGAIFRQNFISMNDEEFITFIRDSGKDFDNRTIVIASMEGENVLHFNEWKKASILLIGNETHGTPEIDRYITHYDFVKKVSIPGLGGTESLNAAIAGSILLYDWVAKKFSL